MTSRPLLNSLNLRHPTLMPDHLRSSESASPSPVISRPPSSDTAGPAPAPVRQIIGKGSFKEEFVTCGGVALSSLDMRTMESKSVPGLFFAGEVVDVDGVTGGFNFQSAWTTGWVAGTAIAAAAAAAPRPVIAEMRKSEQ